MYYAWRPRGAPVSTTLPWVARVHNAACDTRLIAGFCNDLPDDNGAVVKVERKNLLTTSQEFTEYNVRVRIEFIHFIELIQRWRLNIY